MFNSIPRAYQIGSLLLLALVIGFFAIPKDKATQDGTTGSDRSNQGSPPPGSGSAIGSNQTQAKLSGMAGKSLAALQREQLEAEQAAFFEARGITPRRPGSVGINDPIVLFWIDRLEHPDAAKREEAIRKFERACAELREKGMNSPTDLELDKDEMTMRKFVVFIEILARHESMMNALYPEKPNSFRDAGSMATLASQPDMMKLISVFAARLDDPSASPAAKQVIDGFTLNLYSDQPAEWWQNEFPDSQLASIFLNLPNESEQE